MYKKHFEIFYDRLKKYADITDDKRENEAMLKLLLEGINQDLYLQFFSELEAYFNVLYFYDNFNDVMLWINANKDKEFINEVMGTAFAVNKKARAFYRFYWMMNGYYDSKKELCFDAIKDLINKMHDANMSREEIMASLNADNYYFKFYSYAKNSYLDELFKAEDVKKLYKKA